MKRELVENWMSREVITATLDTPLPELHSLMNDYKIRRVPVTQKEQLVGIVTLGDVREAEPSDATSLSIWEVNYLIGRLRAKDIMTHKPVTTTADTTIGQAARLMLEHKVSGLPVVDKDNHIIGIITESDIFRVAVQAWGQKESNAVVKMTV